MGMQPSSPYYYPSTALNACCYHSDDKHTFSDWRLAFEVPLRMVDHNAVPGTTSEWDDRFSAMPMFKEYGDIQDCTFKHVYLDLSGTFDVCLRSPTTPC